MVVTRLTGRNTGIASSYPTYCIMPSSILIGWLSSICSMVVCLLYSRPCAPSLVPYSSNMRTLFVNHSTVHYGICLPSSLCTSPSIFAERASIYFAPNLTPMGIFRRLPYYYIGYVMGQKQLFRSTKTNRDLIGCILCLCISILFFHWHLMAFKTGQHILHIALFYPVNIGFLFGVLYGCKLLNSFIISVITNLSIGTLVIIGLHIIPITITNYVLETLLHTHNTICYHWYGAITVTLIIVAILYPFILYFTNYTPILLGKNKTI